MFRVVDVTSPAEVPAGGIVSMVLLACIVQGVAFPGDC